MKHLLVAEDDEDDFLTLLEIVMKIKMEFDLTRVRDGEELLRTLATDPSPFDVLFLDINMPKKNGLQCLSEIRTIKSLDNFPVVILSTTQDEESVQRAYAAGANLYFVKPYTLKGWKDALEMALNLNWKNRVTPTIDKFIMKFD